MPLAHIIIPLSHQSAPLWLPGSMLWMTSRSTDRIHHRRDISRFTVAVRLLLTTGDTVEQMTPMISAWWKSPPARIEIARSDIQNSLYFLPRLFNFSWAMPAFTSDDAYRTFTGCPPKRLHASRLIHEDDFNSFDNFASASIIFALL
jgi:hypothetical protein